MQNDQPARRRLLWPTVFVLGFLLLIAAAIVLPAIADARESARRTTCKKYLKQTGLALMNYEETQKAFPPGWVVTGASVNGKPEESAYAWQTAILPFLDNAPLFKSIQRDEPFQVEVQRERPRRSSSHWLSASEPTLGDVQIYSSRCPSDVGQAFDTTSTVPQIGTTNYVGNFGVGIPRYGRQYDRLFQGVFCENSSIRIRDIRDGTSNVILVAERRQMPTGRNWTEGLIEGSLNSYWPGIPRGTSPLAIVGTASDGEYPEIGCDQERVVALAQLEFNLTLSNEKTEYGEFPKARQVAGVNKALGGRQLTENGAPPVSVGYSSHHPGGAQFLFGDGTVKYIANKVDPQVIVNISRRADGLVTGEF